MPSKRRKGRTLEIELAAQLSLWWTDGRRDDVFWHTHDSGGRSTRRRKAGKSAHLLAGDICALDPIGQPFLEVFTVEAKKGYNHATVQDFLEGGKAIYREWTAQAKASQQASGAHAWMLVHRRDRRGAVVLLPSDVLRELAWYGGAGGYDEGELLYVIGRDATAVIRLADFLSKVKPKAVRDLAKEL